MDGEAGFERAEKRGDLEESTTIGVVYAVHSGRHGMGEPGGRVAGLLGGGQGCTPAATSN